MLRRLVESGPEGIRRLAGEVVGAAAATGDRGAGDCGAGRDCVGAFRLGQRWVRAFAVMFTIALVVLLALAAVALWTVRFLLDRVRLRLAFVAAARTRESLPAGEPVGGGAGGAGHRRDADSGRLPDAGAALA